MGPVRPSVVRRSSVGARQLWLGELYIRIPQFAAAGEALGIAAQGVLNSGFTNNGTVPLTSPMVRRLRSPWHIMMPWPRAGRTSWACIKQGGSIDRHRSQQSAYDQSTSRTSLPHRRTRTRRKRPRNRPLRHAAPSSSVRNAIRQPISGSRGRRDWAPVDDAGESASNKPPGEIASQKPAAEAATSSRRRVGASSRPVGSG